MKRMSSTVRSWTVRKNIGTASAPKFIWRKFTFTRVDGGWEHYGNYIIKVTKVKDYVRPFIVTLYSYEPLHGGVCELQYSIQSYSVQWGLDRLATEGFLDLTRNP